MSNASKSRTLSLKIGNESISYQMESKRSLDLEIAFFNIILYILIFAFAFSYISTVVFVLLFYSIGMRVMMGNHDRFHTNHSKRLSRPIEAILEIFWVVVTPWDEPYESVKKKHFMHHATHLSGMSAKFDTKNDPHAVYELGGFVRVFLSCVFYEEIQLYLDIRDNRLSKERWNRIVIYLPLIILFIITFGWAKYLVVFFALRLTLFSVWFVFSWVFHQSYFYRFGFSKKVSKWIIWTNVILFGRRIARATLGHAVHHAWPGVPFNELYKIDEIAINNPDDVPDMKPIGH